MAKETRKGGDPRVGAPPARPVIQGTRGARQKRRGSPTVASGRQLEAIMVESAREQLGPEADEAEVERLAMRQLEGQRLRPPDPETPIERWEREARSARAQADLEKLYE